MHIFHVCRCEEWMTFRRNTSSSCSRCNFQGEDIIVSDAKIIEYSKMIVSDTYPVTIFLDIKMLFVVYNHWKSIAYLEISSDYIS